MGAYLYYIVEGVPARISTDPDSMLGEKMRRDGTWHQDNPVKIEQDGHQVSEEVALNYWTTHP
jgi:hypothetical protein